MRYLSVNYLVCNRFSWTRKLIVVSTFEMNPEKYYSVTISIRFNTNGKRIKSVARNKVPRGIKKWLRAPLKIHWSINMLRMASQVTSGIIGMLMILEIKFLRLTTNLNQLLNSMCYRYNKLISRTCKHEYKYIPPVIFNCINTVIF